MFTANLLLGYTIYCLPQIPDRNILIMLLNSCVFMHFLTDKCLLQICYQVTQYIVYLRYQIELLSSCCLILTCFMHFLTENCLLQICYQVTQYIVYLRYQIEISSSCCLILTCFMHFLTENCLLQICYQVTQYIVYLRYQIEILSSCCLILVFYAIFQFCSYQFGINCQFCVPKILQKAITELNSIS